MGEQGSGLQGFLVRPESEKLAAAAPALGASTAIVEGAVSAKLEEIVGSVDNRAHAPSSSSLPFVVGGIAGVFFALTMLASRSRCETTADEEDEDDAMTEQSE